MKKVKPHTVDWAQIERFLTSAEKKLTLRSATSHQSSFMRDDSRHLKALNDRSLKRPGLSREQVCGLCLSCMRATGAIRQKRSSA